MKKIMLKTTAILFLLFLFSYCNNKKQELSENGEPHISNKHPKWHSKKIEIIKIAQIGSDDISRENYIFGLISDMAVDKHNNIYVLDRGLSKVLKYDKNGTFLFSLDLVKGYGPGEFILPRKLAIDSLNNILISDDVRRKIIIFDQDGNFKNEISIDLRISQMTIGKDNNIYLSGFLFSYSGPIIRVYSQKGELIRKICKRRKDSEIVMWTGNCGKLCLDNNGNILYSFFYPYDIRIYNPNGKLIQRFAREVTFYRQPQIDFQKHRAKSFAGSRALAVSPNNLIMHIIFANNESKQSSFLDIFDKKGNYLTTLSLEKYGIKFVRNFIVDNEGNLYFDFMEPFPHINKYYLKISEAN